MTTRCQVCSGKIFKRILEHNPSMSSDGRIVNYTIIKDECQSCGFIFSSDISFLQNFYKEDYQLNTLNLDPDFVYQGKKIPKSEMHFQWISELLGNKINEFRSMIEIGCGSGNLLRLFNVKEKFGVEPSEKASEYASNIANIRNIGYEDISDTESYDFVFSSCVIEHTIDPNHFLKKLRSISHKDSVIVIGLPIQDTESFDVYFLDHLHHFTNKQFIYLCQKNGFKVEKYSIGYKCIETIAYYVLSKANDECTSLVFEKNKNFYISNIWLNNLNEFLEANNHFNILGFGYGETSFFFQSYSSINQYVNIFIDEVRAGLKENVVTIEQANSLKLLNNTIILLLANPHYHDFLINKFKDFSHIRFFSPFSNKLFL